MRKCCRIALCAQVLFDVQAGSIKAGSERSLFSGAVEVAGFTRRYAALAASCLTLMADHDSDDSEWDWIFGVMGLGAGLFVGQLPSCRPRQH